MVAYLSTSLKRLTTLPAARRSQSGRCIATSSWRSRPAFLTSTSQVISDRMIRSMRCTASSRRGRGIDRENTNRCGQPIADGRRCSLRQRYSQSRLPHPTNCERGQSPDRARFHARSRRRGTYGAARQECHRERGLRDIHPYPPPQWGSHRQREGSRLSGKLSRRTGSW